MEMESNSLDLSTIITAVYLCFNIREIWKKVRRSCANSFFD